MMSSSVSMPTLRRSSVAGVPAATSLGIAVINAPAGNTIAVAELFFGALIGLMTLAVASEIARLRAEPTNAHGLVRRFLFVAAGASRMGGGRMGAGMGLDKGFFHEPTIFARVEAGMRIEQEEIFGPVLSVVRVSSVDEAFQVNNGVKYGLSSSVYTQDVNVAFRALNELDNGITYVNAPTIGAEAHLPFGGVKQTGNGHREGGWEVYEFYSETKVGYIDFSGSLQRAQIDTYAGAPY